MRLTILFAAAAALAVAACEMPRPNSNPEAAKKALESSGYTNITDITPLNNFNEECDQGEAIYCNNFVATDRRGIRVAGLIAEETDGEIEIDHQD